MESWGKSDQALSVPIDPLLATKIHTPRPRSPLVHRSRLLQRLQEGRERTLILLSAPARFGKSTLLADWLTSSTIPAAWLSLEPQDNDPHLDTHARALHHPLLSPPLESVLTLLINDLLGRRADDQEHVVLILDNYLVITTESIHHALSFLLEHLHPRCTFSWLNSLC